MAFDPEPATVTLKPVAVNPTIGSQRRALVVARNPIVSVAVPSPMARNPGETLDQAALEGGPSELTSAVPER